ncbi:hypothetical protein CsatB_022012 [Cannabis sativa]
MGWSSILISGSGEPNFDSWVANPFETSKQRREKEVRSLLYKLPPETIMLNPTNIGSVRPMKKKNVTKQEKEAAIEAAKDTEFKYKTKGKNKPSKRVKKKQEVIFKAKRPFLDEQMKVEEQIVRKKQRSSEEAVIPVSLQRFARNNVAT